MATKTAKPVRKVSATAKRKTTKSKAPASRVWFRSVRKSYLPVSWQGWTIYCIYVAYIIMLPVAWFDIGHKLWDLLVIIIPLAAGTTALVHIIAARTSGK